MKLLINTPYTSINPDNIILIKTNGNSLYILYLVTIRLLIKLISKKTRKTLITDWLIIVTDLLVNLQKVYLSIKIIFFLKINTTNPEKLIAKTDRMVYIKFIVDSFSKFCLDSILLFILETEIILSLSKGF